MEDEPPVVTNKSQAKRESDRWAPKFNDSSSASEGYQESEGEEVTSEKEVDHVCSLSDLIRDDLSIRMVT